MKILLTLFSLFTLCGITQMAVAVEATNPPILYLHYYTFYPKPYRILTTKIRLGEELDIRVGADDKTLSGRIDARDGRFFAHVDGFYISATGGFDGEVKLEKPFTPRVYALSGGYCFVYFALSTNSDCEPFLSSQPKWRQ